MARMYVNQFTNNFEAPITSDGGSVLSFTWDQLSIACNGNMGSPLTLNSKFLCYANFDVIFQVSADADIVDPNLDYSWGVWAVNGTDVPMALAIIGRKNSAAGRQVFCLGYSGGSSTPSKNVWVDGTGVTHLRLSRVGDYISWFTSNDGSSWTKRAVTGAVALGQLVSIQFFGQLQVLSGAGTPDVLRMTVDDSDFLVTYDIESASSESPSPSASVSNSPSVSLSNSPSASGSDYTSGTLSNSPSVSVSNSPTTSPSASLSESGSSSLSHSPSSTPSPSSSLSGSLSVSPSNASASASPSAEMVFDGNADYNITLYMSTDYTSYDRGLLDVREVITPHAQCSITGEFYTGTLALSSVLRAQGSISGVLIPPTIFAGPGETSAPGVSANGTLRANASVEVGPQSKVVGLWITYLRNNVVGWSKIGDTRILIDESNEAGYKPLPGAISGLIYQILSFRDKYPVAYGASGAYLMFPVSQPFATFGFKKLGPIGVYQQGCVCGGETQHFFIGTDKNIYVVESKVDQERPMINSLGFAEFVEEISPNGETVVMHYDWVNERVYISSVLGGFVLTSQGLGGGYAALSGATGNYFTAPNALIQPHQEICTDTLDMQNRGIKTIHEVQIGANTDVNLYVAVDYRYDKAGVFTTSPWVIANKEGVAIGAVAGVEFRIRIKNLAHDDFQIDYLNIKFKYTDKRFHRGPLNENVVGG